MSEETLEEGTFKVKLKKPKQLSKQDETIKVDLSKPKEEITPVQETEVKDTPVVEPAQRWTNKCKSPAKLLNLKKKNL